MTDGGAVVEAAPSRPRWTTPVAVLVAAGLLASAGLTALTALRGDTADAATRLDSGRFVDVVLADGTAQPVRDGQEVPRGATVTTRAGGAATLVTRGREVLLGAGTSVTVVDGARQVLLEGLVMVEASDAPGLVLEAAAADVTVRDDALVRVERGPAALRVAVFDGRSTVRSAGRAGTRPVDSLFQVQVPYGGLTGATTPLVLTPDDEWERRYALDLVQDDRDLRALASGLDGPRPGAAASDGRLLSVAPAAVRTDDIGTSPRSEKLLAYLIASSARTGGEDVAARYDTVRGYRRAGGSWGVVAALVASGADGASSALDAVLGPDVSALPAPGSSAGPVDVSALVGRPPSREPSAGPTARPSASRRPPSAPPSTPPPTASPGPVEQVVDAVLGLLPSPTAPVPARVTSPSPPPAGPAQGPVAGVLGLLG